MSPRLDFQRYIAATAAKPVLNVGCDLDPAGFGIEAIHLDERDLSEHYPLGNFIQCDLHEMPFEDDTFHTVILGDVLEHLADPIAGMRECFRVAGEVFAMTVWEEWRDLSDQKPGLQHVQNFTDEEVVQLVDSLTSEYKIWKVHETTHEGHDVYNWLVVMRKEGAK